MSQSVELGVQFPIKYIVISRTELKKIRLGSILKIKPHYRSEGPRQGSCGVFGGSLILSDKILISQVTCSKR